MFYKKNLFVAALTFTVFLMALFTNAQTVIVVLKQPPPNQWHVEDLWQLTLTNTTNESLEVYLFADVEEADAGIIFEGKTTSFTLEPNYSGPVNPGDLEPVEKVYVNDDYEDIVQKTGTLPEGTYTICVYVKSVEGEDMGHDCIMQIIAHPLPPELINPADEANVTEELPVFLWLPPIPMSEFVAYTIKIVELLDGQTPIEAMESNPAFYIEEDIPATSFQFSISARPFETGITYAWKVTAISGDGLVIGESPVWSFNYEAAVVVIDEEPVTLELISPVNGEEITGPILLFEWMPIDTTATLVTVTWTDTLTVTPEVSYNLIIRKLTKDLVEKIAEGYILKLGDFTDLEQVSIIEGITVTSFSQYEHYLELELGYSYGWQVIALVDERVVGQSEIGMFVSGAITTSVDTLNLGVSFALNIIPIDPNGPLDPNPINADIQNDVRNNIVGMVEEGKCGAWDGEAKIYKVTYELVACDVARGITPAGGLNTTFTFTLRRTIFFKWRFRGPCTKDAGHDGRHSPWRWSNWQYDFFADIIIKTKTIGGCPMAMSSSYFKRWLKELGQADLNAHGLGNLRFDGFFGNVGNLCRDALRANPCPRGLGLVQVNVNVIIQQPLAPPGIVIIPGAGGGAMGIGIVDGMDCSKIGFNVYQKAGKWMMDIFGKSGAIPVKQGSPPPYPKVRVEIAYNNPVQISNTNFQGEFERNEVVLKEFKLPFFIDVWYQVPSTGLWSKPCRIELPGGAGIYSGVGTVGGMDCSKISFTVYQQAGKDMIWIYGKEGAVPVRKGGPPYTKVRVDISHNPTIWITNTDHLGAFLYDEELKKFTQPFYIDVWYMDIGTATQIGPCRIQW